MKVIISSNPDNLAKENPDVTIEAEYGDRLVEGRLFTLAHHGPRSGNPAPCLPGPLPVDIRVINAHCMGPVVVGISHLDLDTLGGIRRLVHPGHGSTPPTRKFWELAADVDVHGPHTVLDQRGTLAHRQLAAYWAWSRNHRVFPPKDGSVADVTQEVKEALVLIDTLLDPVVEIDRDGIRHSSPALEEWKELMRAGQDFLEAEQILNSSSYCETSENGVIKRIADEFTNHLYATPVGRCQKAVVALNKSLNSVTVSFAAPIPGVSAKDIVQELWGPEAGGRDVIAGSPRNRHMTDDDLNAAFLATIDAINRANYPYPTIPGGEP